MADNNNNSYTVTPESVGLRRNTDPFTMDLTRDPNSNVSTDTPDDYQKVFDESIGGGINFKRKGDNSKLNLDISKEVPLVRSNILNLDANVRGGAWESTSSKDVYIVNESGKKIGASVKGNLVLDEEGTAILRGRLDKDFTTVDMEELTPLGNYKGQDGKIYTNWDLMLDVGRLGIDFGKKALTLTLGNNGKLSVNPEKVGYEYGIKFNKGGTPMMEKQMEMFEDGGLKDEGGMIDKESGNDVPIGSTRKEVRDDIPAKLSEGEFVFPADVVRFIGLEKLMTIRQKAKMGLQRMEEMGQMGNSDEATMPDDMPFGMSDLIVMSPEGKEVEMAEGGVIHAATGVNVTPSNNPTMTNVQRVNNTGSTYTPYTTGASVVPLPTQPVPTKPVVTASNPPKFPEVMGDAAVTMRQYKNAAGYVMMIPHIGGKPMYPVPEGYALVAEDGTTSDIPPATGETTPAETVKPEEPFDYGGETDMFGVPIGASGGVDSMADAAINFADITLGKKTPTGLEKFFMNTPHYAALQKMQMKAANINTGDAKLDQTSLALHNLQNSFKNLPEGDKKEEVSKSLQTMAYTQYAQSKTLAKDVPGAGKRGGKPSPTEGVTQFTDKTFADLVAATKAKTSTVNPLDIAGTTTVTPDQIQTIADKIAKDKKDKKDKAEQADAQITAQIQNEIEAQMAQSDGSPVGGTVSGSSTTGGGTTGGDPSGQTGGGPGGDDGTGGGSSGNGGSYGGGYGGGGSGSYGGAGSAGGSYGEAGRAKGGFVPRKPKKKMKTYKKGGLATSKK